MPEWGVYEKISDGYSKIKVTGKVETPWRCSRSVDINLNQNPEFISINK